MAHRKRCAAKDAMLTMLDKIYTAATANPMRIVLPEGAEPRIVRGALAARDKSLARIILLGPEADILAQIDAADAKADGLTLIDPEKSPLADELATRFHDLRKHRGMTPERAQAEMRKPHVFAAMMVRAGHADGTLGGATLATAEIVRAAIQAIGAAPGATLVSSYFLMVLNAPHHGKPGAYVFSDAGLVVDPSAEELAEIAVSAAGSFTRMTGEVPRVAMLSFSSHGSARHERVSKVQEATELARAKAPDLLIDGELQFDAAFIPEIGQAKAPNSAVAGAANVFIFPNLDAGNIGYKIAQRIGGAEAYGPILQGLAKPANDLSRGCSAEDVTNMIAITAVQAQQARKT